MAAQRDTDCWALPPFTRFWVGPVWPLPWAVLQARPPPGTVSNHEVDRGFEPESLIPETLQYLLDITPFYQGAG